MAKMTINNRGYVGNSITVINDRVIIDGKEIPAEDEKVITIQVEGNVDNLNVDACKQVSVNGTVGSLTTVSGDVDCMAVHGNVQTTSGDVECTEVQGSVKTVSGDVSCATVAGSVNSVSGDIKHRK